MISHDISNGFKWCEFVLKASESTRFCALPACRANGENRGAVRKISHFSLTDSQCWWHWKTVSSSTVASLHAAGSCPPSFQAQIRSWQTNANDICQMSVQPAIQIQLSQNSWRSRHAAFALWQSFRRQTDLSLPAVQVLWILWILWILWFQYVSVCWHNLTPSTFSSFSSDSDDLRATHSFQVQPSPATLPKHYAARQSGNRTFQHELCPWSMSVIECWNVGLSENVGLIFPMIASHLI